MRKEKKITEDGGWFGVIHFLKGGSNNGSFPSKRAKVMLEAGDANRVKIARWFRYLCYCMKRGPTRYGSSFIVSMSSDGI